MSFGIGFGAFAQGLLGGLKAGDALVDSVNSTRSQIAKQKAIASAKEDYDKDIADKVVTQAGQAAASAPGIGPAFDAEGAAKKARAENPFMDYLYNQKMPGILDSMVQAGDLDGAKKMQQWASDAKERKFMEGFGKVLTAGAAGKSSGDYTDFADQSKKLFNSGNYGMNITGYDFVKDGDGKTTGITYTLQDGDKTIKHTFNSMDEAGQFIAGNANPTARYKQWAAESEAATKLKADVAKEKAKAVIGIGKDITIEDHKQQNRVALDDHKTENEMWKETAKTGQQKVQQQRAAEFKTKALREAGYSEDRIKELLPAILGVSDTRKKASPEDRVASVRRTLSNDYEFSRKSPEEQSDIIRKLIAADDQIAADIGKNDAAPAQAQPKPRMNVFR